MTRHGRRHRTKFRKPKYISLRRHLAPPPPTETAPQEERSASSSFDMSASSTSAAPYFAGTCEDEESGKAPQQLETSPIQLPDHLARDSHVASLLLLDDGNRSIAALFGDDGAVASSGSPPSSADSPTSCSMNWDGLARRALRGRERLMYCHSLTPASSGNEEMNSAGGGAGRRVADLWWCFAGTAQPPRAIALKLDYDEILSAWSDRGPLYIEGDAPQVVPQLDGDCCEPYYAFPVMVEVGPSEAWRAPEIIGAPAGMDGGTAAEGKEKSIREERVRRYKEKRRSRLFAKRIRYEVRKQNAERRPRLKGRFVRRKDDSEDLLLSQ